MILNVYNTIVYEKFYVFNTLIVLFTSLYVALFVQLSCQAA